MAHRKGIHGLRSLPSVTVTLDDLAPSWERSLRARNVSTWTLQSYLAALKKLRGYLVAHELPLTVTTLTRGILQDFLAELLATGKPSSASNRYTALDQFCKWCVAEGELVTSPMMGVRRPSVPETPPVVLRDDQLRALLKVCEGTDFFARRDTALIRVLIDTGLRRSELAGLLVADVDLIICEATVRNAKFRRQRTVAFRTKAAAALDRYLRLRAQHPDHALPNLWLGRAGALGHDAVYKIVKKRAAQAQIGTAYTHLFRHSFADAWKRAGGSEEGLMQMAGWRDPKMVIKYGAAHRSERARDEARKLELGDRL